MASSAFWLLLLLIIPVTAIAGYLFLRLTGTHLTARRALRDLSEEVENRHNIEIVTTSPEDGVSQIERDQRSGYEDELTGYRHPPKANTFGDSSNHTGHLHPYGNTGSEDSGEAQKKEVNFVKEHDGTVDQLVGPASLGNSWRAGIAPKPNPRPVGLVNKCIRDSDMLTFYTGYRIAIKVTGQPDSVSQQSDEI